MEGPERDGLRAYMDVEWEMEGREGTPARGPVGMDAGPVGIEGVEGVEGMIGEGVGVWRIVGVMTLVVRMGEARGGGAAPQVEVSGRDWRSLLNEPRSPNEPLPPRMAKEPRFAGT